MVLDIFDWGAKREVVWMESYGRNIFDFESRKEKLDR